MAGQVKFILEADSAKAVQAFLKVVDAQKKTEDGAKRATAAHKEQGRELEKMSDFLKDIAHGALSVVTSFASWEGIKWVIEDAESRLKSLRDEMAKFHQSGAGAETLPVYRANPRDFQRTSLQFSNAFGREVDQINRLRENVAVGMPGANVAELNLATRSILEFAQKTGSNPEDVQAVTSHLRDAYPQLSQKAAEGISLDLREHGQLPIAEQSGVLEKLLVPAQALGLKAEEVSAIAAMAAKSGGAAGSVGKGIITAMTKIPELLQKGLVKKSDTAEGYFAQLDALERTNPAALAEVNKEIGPKAEASISYISKHHSEYEDAIRSSQQYQTGAGMRQLSADVDKNEQLKMAWEKQSVDQRVKNAPLQLALDQDLEDARASHFQDLGETQYVGGDPILSFAGFGKRMASLAMRSSNTLGGRAFLQNSVFDPSYTPIEVTPNVHNNLGSGGPAIGPGVMPGATGMSAPGGSGSDQFNQALADLSRAAAKVVNSIPTTRPSARGPIQPN